MRLFTLCLAWSSYPTDREPSVGESVSRFREPDAGNLPVRFDERVVSRRREIVLLYER